MQPGRRRVAVGLVVAAVLAGAPACGGSGNGEAAKSPAAILKDARAATGTAPSVRVTGRLTRAGRTVALDIVSAGHRVGGTATLDGATLHLVRAGGRVYLRATGRAWAALGAPGSAASVLADRWWSAPATDPRFSSLARYLSVSALVDQLNPAGSLTKGPTTTVGGRSVVPLHDTAEGSTLYVDATGPPYVDELTGPDGRVLFTQYGTAPVPAVPVGATSLASLGG